MSNKIKVGVLFGGRSVEHEVSLQSAKNIISTINKDKYEVVPIGIDKDGRWYLQDQTNFLLHADNPKLITLSKSSKEVVISQGDKANLIDLSNGDSLGFIDVVFPVIHGPFGEDGTIQGLLKLANIPFIGASVLGSSVAMDKDVMKRLLRDANISIGKFLTYRFASKENIDYHIVTKELGLPLFVKPANLGSSVGISKVSQKSEFETAIMEAFQFDNKIIVEEFIEGREIECSVLGNENPIASIPGEIIPQRDFYSYNAKYIDESGALLELPAKLEENQIQQIQQISINTYKTLSCEGMARVDIFLQENGKMIVNEINTIPGFTDISMYPKLWKLSGISQTELIDRLIQLAMDRFEKESKLKTSY